MKCKSCKEEIIFCSTKAGKSIPVNFSSLTDKDKNWLINRPKEMYEVLLPFRYGEHITHFTTCPHSKEWRKND